MTIGLFSIFYFSLATTKFFVPSSVNTFTLSVFIDACSPFTSHSTRLCQRAFITRFGRLPRAITTREIDCEAVLVEPKIDKGMMEGESIKAVYEWQKSHSINADGIYQIE